MTKPQAAATMIGGAGLGVLLTFNSINDMEVSDRAGAWGAFWIGVLLGIAVVVLLGLTGRLLGSNDEEPAPTAVKLVFPMAFLAWVVIRSTFDYGSVFMLGGAVGFCSSFVVAALINERRSSRTER